MDSRMQLVLQLRDKNSQDLQLLRRLKLASCASTTSTALNTSDAVESAMDTAGGRLSPTTVFAGHLPASPEDIDEIDELGAIKLDNVSDDERTTREPETPSSYNLLNLWDDFCVNEYAPKPVSRRRLRPERDEWDPSPTVPVPFSFENRVTEWGESRTLIEYKEQLKRQEEAELIECNRRPIRRPVPPNTKKKLYDKIVTQPNRHHQRRPDDTTQIGTTLMSPKGSGKSLNCNWEELQAWWDLQRMNRLEKAKRKLEMARAPAGLDVRPDPPSPPSQPSFKPKINKGVPDYDKLSRKFEKTLIAARERRESTIPDPFEFLSDTLPSTKHRVKLDMELDEMVLPENRWPFLGPRTKSQTHPLGPRAKAYIALGEAACAPPAKTTRTVQLREKFTKDKLKSKFVENFKTSLVPARDESTLTLQRAVSRKVAVTDHEKEKKSKIDAAIRDRKVQERVKELQYEMQLAEIRNRVQDRPLLIDRSY